jgi:branched-subunit amino acid ABC-type transport system permease component
MKTRYILLLFLGLTVLAWLADRASSGFNTERVRLLSALDWAVMALGMAIAVISGIRLLFAGLQGAKLPQMMPTVIAFLAGGVMYQRYWAVLVAFACVVGCWLVVEHFRPVDKKSEN